MSTLWLFISIHFLWISVLCLTPDELEAQKSGWNVDPNTQYHIQTDEGPERYFRFQTLNGQFRKEKRLEDGTVIGTEGWLDPLGYLRIKDYIADREGFRILKSKMVYVGKDKPIEDAVAASKRVPAQSGVLAKPRRPPNPFRQSLQEFSGNSIDSNTIKPYRNYPSSDVTGRYIPPSTTTYPRSSYFSTTIRPIALINDRPKPISNYITPSYRRQRPYSRAYRKSYPYVTSPAIDVQPPIPRDVNNQFGPPETIKVTSESSFGHYRPDSRRYRTALASGKFNSTNIRQISRRKSNYAARNDNQAQSSSYYSTSPRIRQTTPADQEFPPYDGTHTSADGFQYYLKTHYHEEEQKPDKSIGSYGYVDPFGIRRVVYYKADGQNGFVHKKNNRFVGFDATPYDPVPPKTQ